MLDEIRVMIKDWEHCLETGNAEEAFKLANLLETVGCIFNEQDGVWQINLNPQLGNAL